MPPARGKGECLDEAIEGAKPTYLPTAIDVPESDLLVVGQERPLAIRGECDGAAGGDLADLLAGRRCPQPGRRVVRVPATAEDQVTAGRDCDMAHPGGVSFERPELPTGLEVPELDHAFRPAGNQASAVPGKR